MQPVDEFNDIFQLAAELVKFTERSLFLTGKAGTGKTTFLHHIRENISKNVIVAAPTGVAAINAGGTTLHSLFQLPFEPHIPDGQHSPAHYFKLHKNKIDMLRELELLIIDEVSMLRADLLDAIDYVLRHYRHSDQPFGGVQMLYIGDMFQLPPVVKSDEWNILGKYYHSPFFFHAKAIEKSPPLYIELKKIYRQNEQHFIDILNKIRNNHIAASELDFLNTLYNPAFELPKDEKYIILSTHNYKADVINNAELGKLPSKEHVYRAIVESNFPESSYPTDFELKLKQDAQIMFVKNDSGDDRRYYNGKLGTVVKLETDKITVELEQSHTLIEVTREKWTNIKYSLDRESGKILEDELGSFTQFPIRPAWAITIHKSQGLTFERAVIDAGQAFASGQVYVALSRCTTFAGIVLLSKITPAGIKTDPEVIEFARREQTMNEIRHILDVERPKYLRKALTNIFDWTPLLDLSNALLNLVAERTLPNREAAQDLALNIKTTVWNQSGVAEKFKDQLNRLLNTAESTGNVAPLKERMQKAALYFYRDLKDIVITPLDKHLADLKKVSKVKQYQQAVTEIRNGFASFVTRLKNIEYGSVSLTEGIVFDEPKPAAEQSNPKTEPAKRFPEQSRPKTEPAKRFPEQSRPKTGKQPEKGASHRISLEMFKEGKTIDEIAAERTLSPTTIEGHLASFVSTGEIDIKELVPEEKIKVIAPLLENLDIMSSISEVKNQLGSNYSYGEIRAVLYYVKKSGQ
ncbi:MAG: helix-turn-helix domain-containing protein [Prevotellaceae bacterium]|jgi:hypothetical protein|nr:helix-turn-helix domain-containing protein [Prevotellaceae bacterium]